MQAARPSGGVVSTLSCKCFIKLKNKRYIFFENNQFEDILSSHIIWDLFGNILSPHIIWELTVLTPPKQMAISHVSSPGWLYYYRWELVLLRSGGMWWIRKPSHAGFAIITQFIIITEMEGSFCNLSKYIKLSTTTFFTGQDSWAVMVCANVCCCNLKLWNRIIEKFTFLEF